MRQNLQQQCLVCRVGDILWTLVSLLNALIAYLVWASNQGRHHRTEKRTVHVYLNGNPLFAKRFSVAEAGASQRCEASSAVGFLAVAMQCHEEWRVSGQRRVSQLHWQSKCSGGVLWTTVPIVQRG